MTAYVSKVGACAIGGVDMWGASHDPIKFTANGSVEIGDDEGQTYDQTIRTALEAGTIAVAKPASAKTSRKKD